MDNIRDLITSNYSKLTDSERHVARIILDDINVVQASSIDELAELSSVSKSTIIRFTKKLGLDGFSELKILMKLHQFEVEDIKDDFVDRVCDNEIQVINYFRNYDFNPIIQLLDNSETIYAFGTGTFQRSFVKEIHRSFLQIGKYIRVIDSHGELEATLNLVSKDDTLIIASFSGENERLEEFYDLFKIKGVNIVSFTHKPNSTLAYMSNYNVTTEVNRERFKDLYFYDNQVTMYTAFKILFAKYITYKNKMRDE